MYQFLSIFLHKAGLLYNMYNSYMELSPWVPNLSAHRPPFWSPEKSWKNGSCEVRWSDGTNGKTSCMATVNIYSFQSMHKPTQEQAHHSRPPMGSCWYMVTVLQRKWYNFVVWIILCRIYRGTSTLISIENLGWFWNLCLFLGATQNLCLFYGGNLNLGITVSPLSDWLIQPHWLNHSVIYQAHFSQHIGSCQQLHNSTGYSLQYSEELLPTRYSSTSTM